MLNVWNQTSRLIFCCGLIPELTNTGSCAWLGSLSMGKIEVSQCLGTGVAAPLWLKSLSGACPAGVTSHDFSRYQYSSLYRPPSYEPHLMCPDAVYKGSHSIPHSSPLYTTLLNHNHILVDPPAYPNRTHYHQGLHNLLLVSGTISIS